jgi:hypothetical protein
VTDGEQVAIEGATEDGATEAVEPMQPAAADGEAEVAATIEGQPPLAELLTAEGFDADAVIAYIQESDLNPVARTSLSAVVEAARDNPTAISNAIDQVRLQLLGE